MRRTLEATVVRLIDGQTVEDNPFKSPEAREPPPVRSDPGEPLVVKFFGVIGLIGIAMGAAASILATIAAAFLR
jgi:hypothetical protein